MSIIFMVRGETGMGFDYQHWNAKCFRDPEQAQAHIKEIHDEIERISSALGIDKRDHRLFVEGTVATASSRDGLKVETKLRLLDPGFVQDYDGTTYWVEEIELVDASD